MGLSSFFLDTSYFGEINQTDIKSVKIVIPATQLSPNPKQHLLPTWRWSCCCCNLLSLSTKLHPPPLPCFDEQALLSTSPYISYFRPKTFIYLVFDPLLSEVAVQNGGLQILMTLVPSGNHGQVMTSIFL